MKTERKSGILLHPTSLPGQFGIGELGSAAYRFIDFLEKSEQQLWQICPLGPTGFGDSPYQCFSAVAGNPYLISIERLKKETLIKDEDLIGAPNFSPEKIDYGRVIPFKLNLLKKAYERWQIAASEEEKNNFNKFIKENKDWLYDFSLFMAIKDEQNGASWNKWPQDLALRKKNALSEAEERLADCIQKHAFYQYVFFKQWNLLKNYANQKGISIIGDIPIFVAYDSCDVWANRKDFYLDKNGIPTVVAGVPPDYFSATGQRWGNPLYRWSEMKKKEYSWWSARFKNILKLVDIVRLDHFRGFAAYWEISAEEETAINGKWVKGPGMDLFRALKKNLGKLPIIAEDLGVITPDVEKLLEESGFPGMRVLQFAFDGKPDNIYLPYNHPTNSIVYTATHDNDTCEGWFKSITEEERQCYRRYTAYINCSVHWQMMRLAMSSVSNTCIVPLQDVMGLDSEARMNFPGRAGGNWCWRFNEQRLDEGLSKALADITKTYGRGTIVISEKV